MANCIDCTHFRAGLAGDTCAHPQCTNPVTGQSEHGVAAWARALWCIDGRYFEGVTDVSTEDDRQD